MLFGHVYTSVARCWSCVHLCGLLLVPPPAHSRGEGVRPACRPAYLPADTSPAMSDVSPSPPPGVIRYSAPLQVRQGLHRIVNHNLYMVLSYATTIQNMV